MMVSLRSITYDELKKQISKEDKIILWSCNTCIKYCGIGGFDRMVQLEEMLKADGYDVIGKELLSVACLESIARHHKMDPKKQDMFNEATVIITLTCEDGHDAANETFKDKKVIGITKTVGVGNFTMDRGPVLTHPFENTGLVQNEKGYTFPEVAEKCNLYPTFFDDKVEHKNAGKTVTITVNGKKINANEGEVLLNVCEQNGIKIPHLCYEKDLTSAGACRLCLVKVKGQRGLSASCSTKVADGMEVITEDDEINHYRKTIVELLLASHEHNCLYCSKGNPCIAGSCELQELVRKYEIDSTSFDKNEEVLPVDDTSPILTYDPNKCVLCGRCVRACEEIAAQNNLGFINRGSKTVVAAATNKSMDQSDCLTCLACVFACPTGAITEKIIHYSGDDFKETKVRQS